MVTPQRIRLSRRKGFNLQEASRKLNGLEAVNCARPSHWGNPFTVVACGSAEEAVRRYRARINPAFASLVRSVLSSKNLACWCKLDAPCHCDVLLSIANRKD